MLPRPVRSTCLAFSVAIALWACAGVGGSTSGSTRPSGSATSRAQALVAAPQIRVRISDGPVSQPIPHPEFARATMVLRFPAPLGDKTTAIVITKETAGAFAEWLRFAPRVQPDGTLKVAGLADGHYRIAARCDDVDYEGECRAVAGAPVAVTMRVFVAAPVR